LSGYLLPDDVEALRKARVGATVLAPSMTLQIAAVLVSDSDLFGTEKKNTAFCARLQQGEAAEILSAKSATEAARAVFSRAAQCWHHCSGRLPDTRLGFDAVFDPEAAQTPCLDVVDPRTVVLEIDRGFAGNAADSRGYRLLGTPFRGEAGPTCLAKEIESNSAYASALAAAFGADLMAALRRALDSKSATQRQARKAPSKAKVIMLPQEGHYSHLTPLTSVPLAITIRDRIRHRRMANRAALDSKKQAGIGDRPDYAPAPPLAYQAFGGTKPQNGGFLELQAINGQLPLLSSTSPHYGATLKGQNPPLERLQWRLDQGVLPSWCRPLRSSAFLRKSIAALGDIGSREARTIAAKKEQLGAQLQWVLPLAERFVAPLWELRVSLSALDDPQKASLRRAMRACLQTSEDVEDQTPASRKTSPTDTVSPMSTAELDFLTTDAYYDAKLVTAAHIRILVSEVGEALYRTLAARLEHWAQTHHQPGFRPFLSLLVVEEAVRRHLDPFLPPAEIAVDAQTLDAYLLEAGGAP